METINTVNFEDLFDFSPEPVDQVAASGGGAGERGTASKPTDIISRARAGSAGAAAAASTSSGGRYNEQLDAFAEFDRAVLAGGAYLTNRSNNFEASTGSKLSASVPASWNSGGGGGISTTATTTASSSADTKAGGSSSFVAAQSVGQLLNQLPAAATAAPGEEEQTAAAVASSLPSGVPAAPVVVKSKRGRKPGQKSLRTDMKTKLERSRQSARECRARKKLRYQYLDDLILEREKANALLREELVKYQKWCHELDKGRIPDGLENLLKEFKAEQQQQQQQQLLQQQT